MSCAPSPDHPGGFCWIHSSVSSSVFYWGAPNWTPLQMRSDKCWIEENVLPQPAVAFCCKATLQTNDEYLFHQDAQVIFCKIAFQPVVTRLNWCSGLFHPRCWTMLLLNFRRFLSTHFFSPSRSLWIAALLVSVLTTPPNWYHLYSQSDVFSF